GELDHRVQRDPRYCLDSTLAATNLAAGVVLVAQHAMTELVCQREEGQHVTGRQRRHQTLLGIDEIRVAAEAFRRRTVERFAAWELPLVVRGIVAVAVAVVGRPENTCAVLR